MKTLTTNKNITARDSHLLPYVNALINYAKSDAEFAYSLAKEASNVSSYKTSIEVSEIESQIKITNRDEAISIAHWVLTESDQSTPATQTALATFSKNYESPKDLLLGIVGVAIIGPTLGILNKRKKQKSHLQVLVNKSFAKSLTPEKLAQFTSEEGQTLMAKELKLAGGNITRLHPDSAEWIMSDPATKVSTVEQVVLTDIAKVIESEKLSGHVKRNGEVIEMVIVSPAVPDSVTEDLV